MTTTNVVPFSFESHEVRTIDRNGEVWFVLNDVTEALEFTRGRDAARMLDDDEKGAHIVRVRSENGVEQDREITVVNESGLYSLILKSRKDSAKRFRKWVTSEVLPAIRKTGIYGATPSPAPRTRKALPGGLTIDQQDAIKALVRSRADALPQDKRAKAAITLWSAVNAKFGTTGKKDGYKNIPADQFGEALSVVARVALEGELLPPGPQISPELSNAIARRTHAIAMNQYGVVRKMIEEMVTGNLKCGASEQECFQYVADFGGLAEESVLVNKWDLVQMARLVSGVVNAAGGAISAIQRLEQNYGIELYPRDSTGNLPPQLMQIMLGAGPVMRGMI